MSTMTSSRLVDDLNRLLCVEARPQRGSVLVRVVGGTDHFSSGPYVYADSLPDLTETKDSLQPGDLLISLNGHELVGVTQEQAQQVVQSASLRDTVQVSFVRNPCEPLITTNHLKSWGVSEDGISRVMRTVPCRRESSACHRSNPQTLTLPSPTSIQSRASAVTRGQIGDGLTGTCLDSLLSIMEKNPTAPTDGGRLDELEEAPTFLDVNPGLGFGMATPALLMTPPQAQGCTSRVCGVTPIQEGSGVSFRHATQSTPNLDWARRKDLDGSQIPSRLEAPSSEARNTLSQPPLLPMPLLTPRPSLVPESRVRLDKLERALAHMGYDLSPRKLAALRCNLDIDRHNGVFFQDFVREVRKVLDEQNRVSLSSLLPEVAVLEPLVPAPQIMTESECSPNPDKEDTPLVKTPMDGSRLVHRRRSSDLEEALQEKTRMVAVLTARLVDLKKNSELLQEEVITLQRKGHPLPPQSTDSSSSIVDQHRQDVVVSSCVSDPQDSSVELKRDNDELKKQNLALACQLRKEEDKNRSCVVAMQTLLDFLVGAVDQAGMDVSRRLKKEAYQQSLRRFSEGGRRTIQVVQKLLEKEELPYGWEQVLTPKGQRCYVNHVTQTTSWRHPVTGVYSGPSEAPDPSLEQTKQSQSRRV